MENAVNKFNDFIRSTEEKLDNLENKVDEKLEKPLGQNSENTAYDASVSLREILDEVKNEYSTIFKEASEVSKLQREMAIKMKEEMMSLVHQLQALQDMTPGQSPEVTNEKAKAALDALVHQSDLASNLSQRLSGD